MKVRYWMFLAVFTLVISTFAFAGNSCALATQADTNGAIKDFDFAAPSSSLYYQFKVSAGHSYSVAVREPYDDGGNNDLTVTVASENTTCNTAVASPTVTTNAEPALATNGFRESFTAPANGTYSVVIANGRNRHTGRDIQWKSHVFGSGKHSGVQAHRCQWRRPQYGYPSGGVSGIQQ